MIEERGSGRTGREGSEGVREAVDTNQPTKKRRNQTACEQFGTRASVWLMCQAMDERRGWRQGVREEKKHIGESDEVIGGQGV